MKTRQWEGEVERGGYGLRVGGDDLNLDELLADGAHVLVTIAWPDEAADGEPLYRIMGTTGVLPPRPSQETGEDPTCLCEWLGGRRAGAHADCPIHGVSAA